MSHLSSCSSLGDDVCLLLCSDKIVWFARMSRAFRTPEQALKKAQEKSKSGERSQAVQALHSLLTSVILFAFFFFSFPFL
jgi:hypothetical protein